jgi:uncharacterized repeat protein (TIGR03803 family)
MPRTAADERASVPSQTCKACIERLGIAWAVLVVFLFPAMAVIVSSAQSFTTLLTFGQTNGKAPLAALAQGTDGNFYGTTGYGGASNAGTVFKVTPNGVLTSLYSFCSLTSCADGGLPQAGLMLGTDGNFYGTTSQGGAYSDGTVFRVTPEGQLTTLHSFDGADGQYPQAGLVQATNGKFYGATTHGGSNSNGTIFEITSAGTLTTLYNFCIQSECPDGAQPEGTLIQATDGNLYGTTYGGGSAYGTVFKITPAGQLTTLHTFAHDANGFYPEAGLIQASNGLLYGATSGGNSPSPGGTVFEITSTGDFSSLYSYCSENGCPDGTTPLSALIQANDGNLYGTTWYGGANGGTGTIFEITLAGQLTTLHSFDGTDGVNPNGLLQSTNGTLYGTTAGGGNGGDGTIFSLSVGLSALVKTTPTSGSRGVPVVILGTNLAGTTAVTFNGTAAPFVVISDSEIKTSVPGGATSGPVQVQTPVGTLTSSPSFQVIPITHCAICITY